MRVAALKGLRVPLGAGDVAGLPWPVVAAIHFGGLPLRLPPPEASRWRASMASSSRWISELSSDSI